jgi:glycerol-3-phosphate dehydrogenase
VEFRFLTEVENIEKTDDGFSIKTSGGDIRSRFVVNAAGVYADRIHNFVSGKKLKITPSRGEYLLMDKDVGDVVSCTVFQLPGKNGKGVLVTPTVHGNLLVGPNAVSIEDKEDTETTADGMSEVRQRASVSVPSVPFGRMITSFSGLRAKEACNDFIIGEAEDVKGFYDAAGIMSPGLTAAPAIGEHIAGLIAKASAAELKPDFIAVRRGIPEVAKLAPAERAALIAERPEYGRIICRCENISEGEIIDAITRVPGARSMDGVKRRVRQGMGRCQGGFCTPGAMQIRADRLGVPVEQIAKNRPGSELIKG